MRLPRLLIGRRRVIFAGLVANGIAQGLFAVMTAWLVMRIFDAVIAPQASVAGLFAGLVATVLATALLRRSERIHAEQLGQRYVRSLRGRLYRRLLNSSTRSPRRRRKGTVLLRFVGDLSAIRRWISLGLARLIVAGITVSIALAALLWLHWPFALAVTAVLSVAVAWILRQSGALRGAIAETRRRQARLAANVTEKLNAITTVQAFGQADREHRMLRRQSDRLATAAVDQAGRIGTLRGVIDATAGGCMLVVLAVAYLRPPGDLSPGMVAAVLSIIGFLTPPLRELGRAQEYRLAARVARKNLLAIARGSERLHAYRNAHAIHIDQGAIALRGIAVEGVLSGIDIDVAGGSRIALTGANGSGKSTLLGLLGRLFEPDRGRILIDDQDIGRARLASLRQQIAYVAADVPLIGATLRRCLCYGAGQVDRQRLDQIVRDCELKDLVARLPRGLDARVAEGGADLSQGERLRVALARALLRNPKVLLLDEADANLDAQAVRALNRTIAQFPGTVVLATHRSASLASCDVHWHLAGGQLRHRSMPTGAARSVPNTVVPGSGSPARNAAVAVC